MSRPTLTLSRRDAFLAVGLGLLSALSFPPAGLWPLAILATCLLLRLLRDKDPTTAIPVGFVYGGVFLLGTMYWFFGIFHVLAFSLIGLGAMYFALLAGLIGITRSYNPYVRALLVGLFAAGVEWIRGDA